MSFYVEYEVGKLIVDDRDDNTELIGTKIVGEILFACYHENGYLVKNIGEYLIYILNELENDIFDSADAHSNRLVAMISNVKIETTHVLYEFNGENDTGITVNGKIAILEDFCITDSKIPAAEDLGFILNQLVLKVNKIFDIDYFLTDKHAFSEDVKNKDVEKLLEEIGFVKSGYEGYIIECC